MKKLLIHIFLTALMTLMFKPDILVAGGKTSLEWKTFNEGLVEAKKLNKKILVDVYTDWCGWCKKMDREVYTDKEVAAYLADQYVVIKLNAESESKLTYENKTISEMELAHDFGVTGYPTTIFMKANGEAITLLPGYLPAEKFIDVLKFVGEDHYLTTKWDDYIGKSRK